MKAYLKFNLPEDEEELLQAQNAGKVLLGLDELREILRSKYKYEDKFWVTIEYVREMLSEIENGALELRRPSEDEVKE